MMSASRAYPVGVEAAFDTLVPIPLDRLFTRRFGPIPAVRSTEGAPPGTWGRVGQVRTVRFAGGGSLREELDRVDRPTVLGYTLSRISGPMKLLASRVDGLWRFEPAGTGTRITWQWSVYPASRLAAPLLPLFAMLWRQYARRSLDNLEQLLLAE